MRIRGIGCKGFTLAEVLISAAITCLLVAVAIPIMKDVVVDSKESMCYSNQKAAQAEFAMGYVLGDYNSAISKSVLPSDMAKEYACPSGGTLFYEISATGDVTVTCSVHTDAGGGAQITLIQQNMDIVVAAIKKKVPNNISVDSEAVDGYNNYQKGLLEELTKQGLDMEAMGIQSWSVNWDSSMLRFDFTTAEISELPAGSIIPIIRYRPDGIVDGRFKGTYSVWEATVTTLQQADKSYNKIGATKKEYSNNKVYDTLSAEDKKDLNKIIEVYNKYNDTYTDIILN